jgi:hypothetical protein
MRPAIGSHTAHEARRIAANIAKLPIIETEGAKRETAKVESEETFSIMASTPTISLWGTSFPLISNQLAAYVISFLR